MNKRSKALIGAALAVILTFSSCQQAEFAGKANVTMATAPEEAEITMIEETDIDDSTVAETTATTTEPDTAPVTAAPVYAAAAPKPKTTTAATTKYVPKTIYVYETTKDHVSGYRGGTNIYPIKHDLEYMKKINKDFIGWLKVNDTPIDIPVMQASDNKFYLEHDFYGRYDKTKVGCIFADSKGKVTKDYRPQNLIIYGHNIRTGVGLAKITNYYPARYGSLNFYKKNPVIKYESIYGGQSQYVVFAGMYVNTETKHGDVFQYHKFRNFTSKNTFYQFFEAVFDRSVFYNPDIDIKPDDVFLTLSTCYYPMGMDVDTRFVVFARQIRKGEKVVNTQNAYTNPSPLYFDYYYKANGGKWAGRKWSESLMQGYSEWKKAQKKS